MKGLVSEKNIKCDKACEMISPYIDGQLEADEAKVFEAHIAVCGDCRREYEEIKTTVAALGNIGEVELPPYFNTKLKAALAIESETRNNRSRLVGLIRYFRILVPAAAVIAVFVFIGTAYPGMLDNIIKGGSDLAGVNDGTILSQSQASSYKGIQGIAGTSGNTSASAVKGGQAGVAAAASGDTSQIRDMSAESGGAEQQGGAGTADGALTPEGANAIYGTASEQAAADNAEAKDADAGAEAEAGTAEYAADGTGSDTGTADDKLVQSEESERAQDIAENQPEESTVTITNSGGSFAAYFKTSNHLISQIHLIKPSEGYYTDRLVVSVKAPTAAAQDTLASGIKQLISENGVSEYKVDDFYNITVLKKESDSDIIFNIAVPESNYQSFAAGLESKLYAYACEEAVLDVTDINPVISRMENTINDLSGYLSSLMKNPLLNAADILRVQADRNKLVSEYESLKKSTGYVFVSIRIGKG